MKNCKNEKDVHTEHCCKYHGCKYGNDDKDLMGNLGRTDFCTVTTKQKIQSYPCESCREFEEPEDKNFRIKRPSYFTYTKDRNLVEVRDSLAFEVSTLFRCGNNEENAFYIECVECKGLFRFEPDDSIQDVNALMTAHGNDNHWYGKKGERFSPTYEA